LIYDSLDNHLASAGSIDRAAVPLGMYVGWCANLGLMSPEFDAAHHELVVRLRYREVKGSELLVAGCGGVLQSECLSPAGQAFTERYYDQYLDDFRATFAGDVYDIEDSWASYEQIAAVLTRAYMAPKRSRFSRRSSDPTVEGSTKRWWQVWR